MFETQEEKDKKRDTAVALAFLLLLIISLGIGANAIYGALRPLPQTDNCLENGFDAGIIQNENEICYDKCSSNKISSCKVMRRLI